jgi:hypothetical protein
MREVRNMKTETVFLVVCITAIAAFGLFTSNVARADQSASPPFAVLSTSAASAPVIQLVRGHGGFHGGGFHGGFHGGGWHGGWHRGWHRGWHGGRHFYRRPFYGGGFYVEPYYVEPYCDYWTWDSYLQEWVCSDVDSY